MSNLLAQIEALDTAITRPTPPLIEPRSLRRAKARDAKAAARTVSNNLVNQN